MKKKLVLILFLSLLLMPFRTLAQEVELTNEDKFEVNLLDNDSFAITSYDDNNKVDGHLIINDGIMTKYGLNNKIIWQKESDMSDIDGKYITPDNAYGLTVKGSTDMYIYKVDTNGNTLWKTQWGGNKEDALEPMSVTYDEKGNENGYLFIGLTTSTDLTGIEPGYVMVKFDMNGKLVWQHNLDESLKRNTAAFSLNNTIYGYQYNGSAILLQSIENIDSDVNTICSYTMPNNYKFAKIVPSKNKNGEVDGAIVVGNINNVKKRTMSLMSLKKAQDQKMSKNNFFPFDEEPAFIIKIDLKCNKVWEQQYGTDNKNAYYSALPSKQVDGTYDGYIAVGTSNSSDLIDSSEIDRLAIINKYDLNGNLVWTKKYLTDYATIYLNINENYDLNGNFNGYFVMGASAKDCTGKKEISLKQNDQSCPIYLITNKYTYKDYNIKKEETDKGTVEVNIANAYPGDLIKVKATPKTGYMVSKIIVKDSLGREIEVNGDSFIMPEGDVTVSVIYARVTNPVTSAVLDIIIFISIIVGLSTILINSKKASLNQ